MLNGCLQGRSSVSDRVSLLAHCHLPVIRGAEGVGRSHDAHLQPGASAREGGHPHKRRRRPCKVNPDSRCPKSALMTTRKPSPLCSWDTWRNRGRQTLWSVAHGNSASFHPWFRQWNRTKNKRPKHIESNRVPLHSVLRPIPICETSFLGSYGAPSPHKQTLESYVEMERGGVLPLSGA
jgi:hypothetical protein